MLHVARCVAMLNLGTNDHKHPWRDGPGLVPQTWYSHCATSLNSLSTERTCHPSNSNFFYNSSSHPPFSVLSFFRSPSFQGIFSLFLSKCLTGKRRTRLDHGLFAQRWLKNTFGKGDFQLSASILWDDYRSEGAFFSHCVQWYVFHTQQFNESGHKNYINMVLVILVLLRTGLSSSQYVHQATKTP